MLEVELGWGLRTWSLSDPLFPACLTEDSVKRYYVFGRHNYANCLYQFLAIEDEEEINDNKRPIQQQTWFCFMQTQVSSHLVHMQNMCTK